MNKPLHLVAAFLTVLPSDRSTLQVIRTMACDYALCSLFVPGDRQIILGTKVFEHTLTQSETLCKAYSQFKALLSISY